VNSRLHPEHQPDISDISMEVPMGDLLIRNIPDALKRDLEAAAARDGRSLSAKSIDLLRKSLASERGGGETPAASAWDVLRPILYRPGNDAEAEDFVRIMEEIEADRKRDFGRPLPDLE
jgi:plasmid stability protein